MEMGLVPPSTGSWDLQWGPSSEDEKTV